MLSGPNLRPNHSKELEPELTVTIVGLGASRQRRPRCLFNRQQGHRRRGGRSRADRSGGDRVRPRQGESHPAARAGRIDAAQEHGELGVAEFEVATGGRGQAERPRGGIRGIRGHAWFQSVFE